MSLVSDRVLNLAVERVKRNCRIALDTRGERSRARAFQLLGPVNDAYMEAAVSSAQLVLDAEKSA